MALLKHCWVRESETRIGAAQDASFSRFPEPLRSCADRLPKRFSRKVVLGAAILALLLAPSITFGIILPPSTAKLAWNANTETDVAGYRVYYGTSSRNYTNTVDVGNVTTNTVTGLVNGTTYYFAVTAYDTLGLESGFSNEISYSPGAPIVSVRMTGNQITLTAVGTVGKSYDVLASQDLKTWTKIGTATTGVSGVATFVDTTSPNYSARFYRLQ